MTFDELKADADFIRSDNSDILNETDYNDTEIQALQYEKAKSELKTDLILTLGIGYDEFTTETTDILEDTNSLLILKQALAYKQLALFYSMNSDLEDGLLYTRFKYNQKKYDELKSKFYQLQRTKKLTVNYAKITR
jgi:hypothetical protein